MTDWILLPSIFAFPVLAAYSAASDLLTMQIPNRISLILIACFLLAAALSGLDLTTIGLHVAVAVGTLVVTFILFAIGQIGGGDAKLAAAIALWMGPEHVFPFLVYTSVFGGLLTLGFLGFRSMALPMFALREPWIARLHEKGMGIPYGIALCIGGLLIFPDTIWFKALVAMPLI
ncbi:A24 family peptidase [Chthonobacter albigriseus]|uniref:A24 family peptidase n=1 Tax=Chthonobacter albigriseus TaxID=1683161 RepID=UPI0015EF57FA|nr:prepilin peptidase [Chthonobacter albigriseus]